jgi:hypothetical protein
MSRIAGSPERRVRRRRPSVGRGRCLTPLRFCDRLRVALWSAGMDRACQSSGSSSAAAPLSLDRALIWYVVRLVLVEAEAEWVAGGVKEHANVLLRLVLGDDRSEGGRFSDRGVQVGDLEVEVQHRGLLSLLGRPHRALVVSCFLEDNVDRAFGRGDNYRARILVTDGPAEQLGVERRQGAWIRRFDRSSPPHSSCSR